jgi:hypothetical protein
LSVATKRWRSVLREWLSIERGYEGRSVCEAILADFFQADSDFAIALLPACAAFAASNCVLCTHPKRALSTFALDADAVKLPKGGCHMIGFPVGG